jgi:hypothetical protein
MTDIGQWIKGLHQKFMTYGDEPLTIILIMVAIVVVVLALSVHNPYFKAILLAYLVLP